MEEATKILESQQAEAKQESDREAEQKPEESVSGEPEPSPEGIDIKKEYSELIKQAKAEIDKILEKSKTQKGKLSGLFNINKKQGVDEQVKKVYGDVIGKITGKNAPRERGLVISILDEYYNQKK